MNNIIILQIFLEYNKKGEKLMLKLRITFADDEEGNKELEKFIKNIEKENKILNISKPYRGRGKSIYSNIYIDVK